MRGRLAVMTQYFDEDPLTRSRPVTIEVALPGLSFPMTTDRGVFSYAQLDTGTALLLREASAPPASGNVLDLGCGSGAIALALALRSPGATVWAVDVNARARHLTATNAARNKLGNLRVSEPDEVPDDVSFAAIWSNPPIRIGKPALHELLARWLARLAPEGEAVLVVQKHLGADSLQRWLIEQGHATERIASRTGFRLLRVAARS
jgi:16S rRNA (guanine1207-N2)-methyltransferase